MIPEKPLLSSKQNQVQARVDLTGKAHFDKATGTIIETPHVHEQQIHTSPGGQTNLGAITTRPATSADIQKARQIINKDQQ